MSRRHARPRSLPLPRRGSSVKAGVGDRITVASRAAVIVEVQNGNGAPPYVVVWSDNGQRALLYPPGDAQIQRLAG